MSNDRFGLDQPTELFHAVDWDRAAEDPKYRERAQKAFQREYPRGRSDPQANPPKAFAHLIDAYGRPYQGNSDKYFPKQGRKK